MKLQRLSFAIITALTLTGAPAVQAGIVKQDFIQYQNDRTITPNSFVAQQLKNQGLHKNLKNIKTIGLDLKNIRKADAFAFTLPNGDHVHFDSVKRKNNGKTFSITATSKQIEGYASFVVGQKGQLTGSIVTAHGHYVIRPVATGGHIIAEPVNRSENDEPVLSNFKSAANELNALNHLTIYSDGTDSGNEITVMVPYTALAAANATDIESQIQLAVDEANLVLRNSQIHTSINLVHSYQTDYTQDSKNSHPILLDMQFKSDGDMDEIYPKRDEYAADIVMLITGQVNDACGRAYAIGAQWEFEAIAMTVQNCLLGNYTFVHEIGHLMGARHDDETDPTSEPFEFGHGIRNVAAGWRTAMAYPCSDTRCPRIPYFSNPQLSYQGNVLGTENLNNNARVFNTTRTGIANFRQSKHSGASRWVKDYSSGAGNWDADKHIRTMADVDGDGKKDIVGFGSNGVFVSRSDNNIFTKAQKWHSDFGYTLGWRKDLHQRVMADVNGDGKDDIVAFGGQSTFVALSTGSGFDTAQSWTNSYSYNSNWRNESHVRKLADVNNDGKADIVGFFTDGVYVSLSNGNSFAAPDKWSSSFTNNSGWANDTHIRTVEDMNNDGRADIVGFGNEGMYVALSNGNGFDAASLWINDFGINAGWTLSRYPRQLADVNGDGLPDIVGFGAGHTYVALSNGNGMGPSSSWSTSFSYNSGWRTTSHLRQMADMNADGKLDVVGFGNEGVYVALAHNGSFAPATLWIDNYGSNGAAGDWTIDGSPRFVFDVNGDGKQDVIGMGSYEGEHGTHVSLSNGINRLVP